MAVWHSQVTGGERRDGEKVGQKDRVCICSQNNRSPEVHNLRECIQCDTHVDGFIKRLAVVLVASTKLTLPWVQVLTSLFA